MNEDWRFVVCVGALVVLGGTATHRLGSGAVADRTAAQAPHEGVQIPPSNGVFVAATGRMRTTAAFHSQP
jgi:predicted flavoprotein YhiN